jgi:hypothetical protein
LRRARSPGETSAHLPAATRHRVCRIAGPTALIRLARPGGAHLFKPLRQVIESVNDSFKGQPDLNGTAATRPPA